MAPAYHDVLTFVQHLAPTWRKTQHVVLTQILLALLQRPRLSPTEIARGMPCESQRNPTRPLHGRQKRVDRFLSNPRLDEGIIFSHWLKLSLRFGADLPQASDVPPLLTLLLDTTYFEPFAALIVSVPCGGRGLPVAFTTYHRRTLEACFPLVDTLPTYDTVLCPPAPRQGRTASPSSAVAELWPSQNLIEEHLLDYVWSLLSPSSQAVVVADRGFARASLFRWFLSKKRLFVIRFDPTTWLLLPDGTAAAAETVLPIQPGQCLWLPHAHYGKKDQVPVAVLAVWDHGQKQPWYLAANLDDPQTVETAYRWRMRIESGNRDEKTGVLLREGGDDHRLSSVLHLQRLLLVLFCAHWLAALTGLQAYRDLAPAESNLPHPLPSLEHAAPNSPIACQLLDQGPAQPPPVIPHRGPTPELPPWMRRFAVRGWLSYVRLGLEVLRTQDLNRLVHRLARWLGIYFWPSSPLWRPAQLRYRLKHWWPVYS